MVTLGGLVNTLVVLPGNETVQIKVEGQLLQEYYGIDTSKPLSFIEGLFPDK
jgi:spore germination protein GerM